MDMAISSRVNLFSLLKPSSKTSPSRPSLSFPQKSQKWFGLGKGREGNSMSLYATGRFGSLRSGADLLERPTFDQSQFDPSLQVEEGGDIGSVRERRGAGSGDSYRVLLVDDTRHTETLVAKVLPQVVPSVIPDVARRLFFESRQHGVAVVIVALKEHAEFYAQMMLRGGLRSAIEPDSNVA